MACKLYSETLPKLPRVYFQALGITATSYDKFQEYATCNSESFSEVVHGVLSSPKQHQPQVMSNSKSDSSLRS